MIKDPRESLRQLERHGEDAIWRVAKAAGEAMDQMSAALAEAQAESAEALMRRLNLDGEPDASRLLVMAQNPANHHHWTRSVGGFTAGEVRRALARAEGRAFENGRRK